MAATHRNPVGVLIVDRDPGRASRIAQMLVHSPRSAFQTTTVQTLADAIGALDYERVDVCVLDPALPDAMGELAVRGIRGAAPDLPLVVIAESPAEALALGTLSSGADDYLTPEALTPDGVERCLRYALECGRSRTMLASLLRKLTDAAVVVDDDGTIQLVNPAAASLFGRSADDLTGELFGFPLSPGRPTEVAIEVPGAGQRTAEMRVTEITWRGDSAYLASLRDVTDRKRAEELQLRLLHADKLASIGQLSAGVAHEINNPATYIIANLSMMKEQMTNIANAFVALRSAARTADAPTDAILDEHRADESLQALAEMVADSLHGMSRIRSITQALRSFSRIDQEEIEQVDLNAVVRDACNLTGNELRHRARLVQRLSPLPPISAHRGKLSQVLVNLIVNAAHAIEEGAAEQNEIKVETMVERGAIVCAISDTGRGIEAENLERIFEPFFTTKPRDQGTGLGLALAAEIVRKHGGRIAVTSELGRGSRFEIRIPIESELTVPGDDDAPEPPEDSWRSFRILVVDDDPHVRKGLRRMLGGARELREASGGVEALDLLADDGAFDVVICDVMMPEMDGIALYHKMCELYPDLARRVVFLSGGAFTARSRKFLMSKSLLIIEKPVARDDLLRALERAKQGIYPDW